MLFTCFLFSVFCFLRLFFFLSLDLLCQTHLFFHLLGLLFDPDTNADILSKRLQFFGDLTDPDTVRFAPVEPLPLFRECLYLFFQRVRYTISSSRVVI